MIKSNFREWTLDSIDEAFGTQQVDTLPVLEEWLSYSYQINDYERTYLTKLANNFLYHGGDDWNEVELENKFISPLFVFSEIDSKSFAYFLERELSVTIDNYELSGKVDGMIATGYRSPKKPYFCFNEYKRGTDPNGDPKGQALIAMLAAQNLNSNQKPIFGCFVIGRSWYFLVLQDNLYAISNVYTCTDEEIFDIYRIIKGLRHHIALLIQ
ncbi:MAG: hypothetical protein MUE30_05240 [Spirosomaceae bacterium]|jgi:hypothetical protein|nr:hypothetical protein [Spirosomataceae bacterium]